MSLPGVLTALVAALFAASAQRLPDLPGTLTRVGDAPGFENDYVRVRYAFYEYTATERQPATTRPLVLFITVGPLTENVTTGPLPAPPKARPSWRPGVMPRGVSIELLRPPPRPLALGVPGTDLPPGAREVRVFSGGRILAATFQPLHYGVGAGPSPSVTTFLSDGVVEVSSQGVRRRMGVQAGDAFWFDAGTRLTVVDDYPIGAVIVELTAGQ